MKRFLGIVFALVGLALFTYFATGLLIIYSNEARGLKTVDTTTQVVQNTPEEFVFTPSPTEIEATPEPSLVPTEVIIVPEPVKILTKDYIFSETIDLSSGDPLALILRLPEGKLLKTNWAGTKPYIGGEPSGVFAPHKGVVYSYLGDVTTTWTHSGVDFFGQRYFATDLDFLMRKDESNNNISLSDSEAKAKSLIGTTAFLCQEKLGNVKLLSDFVGEECLGKRLELELVAFAVVPHEKLGEYDLHVMAINQWMQETFPGTGFENLTKENGWIIRFCISEFPEQINDGSPWYLYNRGVIGFRIKE